MVIMWVWSRYHGHMLCVSVPSYRRCHQMAVLPENEKVIKLQDGDADEEGWVDTHHGLGECLWAWQV